MRFAAGPFLKERAGLLFKVGSRVAKMLSGQRILVFVLAGCAWAGHATAQDIKAAEAHLIGLAIECERQLGLEEAKCACVVDEVRDTLLPIEIEYAAVRIAANETEITRLREILPLGQRLRILWRILEVVDDCADGAPYINPL